MLTMSGVVQNSFHVLNNPQSSSIGMNATTPATETLAGCDAVEISAEAKDALLTDQALTRSEELMRTRGLNEEEIVSFRDIISRYESSGMDAGDFLKSLTGEERNLVKRSNSYGHDLTDAVINGFSEEGAINILREQDYRFAVDLNGDDIVEKGAGKTFVFPPPSTPESVMDAWDSYSRTLSEREIFNFSSMFLPVDIPGYPEATTIRGYNLNEQGFPQTQEGWQVLLDRIHDTLAYSNKTSGDPQQIEHNEEKMQQLREFATYLQ